MTSRQPCRPCPAPSAAFESPVAGDGVVASLTGFDGIVIATISRTVESAGPDGDWAVVTVDGDVDRDTAGLLERALLLTITERPRTCLDLARANHLDAAGVRVLFEAHRHAAELGHVFRLRGARGTVRRVLSIVGMDRAVPVPH